MPPLRGLAALGLIALLSGCAGNSDGPRAAPERTTVASSGPVTAAASEQADAEAMGGDARETTPDERFARPRWLGTRVLPLRADGFGEIRPTPRILRNRRLATPDHLPPPPGPGSAATIRKVPPSVAARSTWKQGCPVSLDELRYVRVPFWGFDGERHTGELLVHRSAARDLAGVFRALHRARFPIEEMRVVAASELDEPPTGDGNNTTAFVCRPARGSTSFSAHAYGLAVDINPFHNPYVKRDVVLPELASAYVNRSWRRPGMLREGDVVVRAFDRIRWSWGGRWSSLADYMHFSATGR